MHVGDIRGRSGENVLGSKSIVQVVLGTEGKGLAEVRKHVLIRDGVGRAGGRQVGDAGTMLGPLMGPEGVVVALV